MRLLCLILCFALPLLSFSQERLLLLKDIEVEGNNRTKRNIILRELRLKIGDSIALSELMPELKRNEQLIMNMGIFLSAQLNVRHWEGDDLVLQLKVKEDWYIYPIPLFEFADRNFNVWWVRHQRSLRRINLGVLLQLRNFSGQNDAVELTAQAGYTNKYEIKYRLPFFDAQKRFGLRFNALFSRNREIAYTTQANKLLFYRDLDSREWQYQRLRLSSSLTYRKGFFSKQALQLSFRQLRISDTVAQLNTRFFGAATALQRSLNLRYTFVFDSRNIRPYPTKGHYISAELFKEGLGIWDDINQLSLTLTYGQYIPFNERWHLSFFSRARYRWQWGQPAYQQQMALGYQLNHVRGYQLYVVDGQHFALAQVDLHRKIWETQVVFPLIPVEALRKIPLRFYLRSHLDWGYARDHHFEAQNPLANEHLLGTGLGLDMVFYFNSVLQIDYSVNKFGENNLYLHYKLTF